MEASAIPASVGLARSRITIGASLLRIRSDEQLVTLFREGNDEAFRVIHDRYRARMFAYARQMLGTSGQDPEDAVQEIFMRAYYGLRANRRELALRAWLYRIAHNRCIDDLRRPLPLAMDARDSLGGGSQDPVARVEQRDALRRLISDVQRLPDQQRSALLMRELSGMSYAEVSGALGVSNAAVKSLLVRARVGLAQASEARNTACAEIRADLVLARDRGVRTSGLARRHLRECDGCRAFRSEVRGVNRQLAALAPTLGPIGIIANLLGWGGGGAGGSAMAGSGAAAAGGSAFTAGGSAAGAASTGLLATGAGHVATLLAAAVVTAGGAVEIQSTLSAAAHHAHHRAAVVHTVRGSTPAAAQSADVDGQALSPAGQAGAPSAAGPVPGTAAPNLAQASTVAATVRRHGSRATPITMLLDPDMYSPQNLPPPVTAPGATDPNAAASGGSVTSSTPGSDTGSTSSATGAQSSGVSSTSPGTGTATSSTSSTDPTTTGGSGTTATSTGSQSGSTAAGSGSSDNSATASGSASSSATKKSSTGSSAVGSSTSSAGAQKVVTFIAHRRPRGRRMLDTLVVR